MNNAPRELNNYRIEALSCSRLQVFSVRTICMRGKPEEQIFRIALESVANGRRKE